MHWRKILGLWVIGIAALAGCAQPGAQPGQTPAGGAAPQSRTLGTGVRVEPANIAGKALVPTGLTLGATQRLFNAGLVILDDRGLARPYLSENVPELSTDTWRVLPDGHMETTYRLRPNLTWHDGAPLTAKDMVFAWQLFTNRQFGVSQSPPQGQIEEITAPDARTVLIRWAKLYPKAGQLQFRDLPPMPAHLLEQPLQEQPPDAFLALPFWTTEYVAAGPFRLDHWEAGAYLEVAAFEGHALGRPKIDRIRLTFINDANAALANLLSGSVSLLIDDAIYFQQAVVLRREWEAQKAGTVLVVPGLWRFTQVQLLPERQAANARGLSDLRVRKALAYAVDKQAISDSIYEGEGIHSDTVIPSTVEYYKAVDDAVVKYPFDPRRTEQLMAEAGYTKGTEGLYTHATLGRFSPELEVIQNAQNESEQHIMAATWRQVGFDVHEAILPVAQAQDGQVRAMFEALFTTGGPLGEDPLVNLGTAGTPKAENRWNGTNRGSWLNTDYDRLVDAFNTTLDRAERVRQIAQMVQIFSDELPSIAINFNPGIIAFSSVLTGPQITAPDSSSGWNIHEWELQN